MSAEYLTGIKKLFQYYKSLGEKTIAQVPDDKLLWKYNEESNSIGTIVKHMWGNMLSRWTDFLNSDGEKEWRQREAEFENDIANREELMKKWNEGWNCLFNAIDPLKSEDLDRKVYIRNEGLTAMDAICRQLAHYSYHVGQIVFLGKMICDTNWTSLSIPKGESQKYNAEKFSQEKRDSHFTDEFLKKQ